VRRRRHLGSEEAGADDHERPSGAQVGAQGEGVVQGAQHVHTRQVVSPRQPARPGAGGQHDAVAGDRAAVGEHDLARRRPQRDSRDPQLPVDVEGVVGIAEQGELALLGGTGQEGLGQRWAVVRQVHLGADDGQPPVEALLAQGADGRQPGQRGPDHRDLAHHEAAAAGAGST